MIKKIAILCQASLASSCDVEAYKQKSAEKNPALYARIMRALGHLNIPMDFKGEVKSKAKINGFRKKRRESHYKVFYDASDCGEIQDKEIVDFFAKAG